MDLESSLLLSLPLNSPRCKLREYRQKEKTQGNTKIMCTVRTCVRGLGYAGTYVHIVLGYLSENFNQAADSQESPHTTALCFKAFVVMLQIVFLLIGTEEIAEGSASQG